MHAVTKRHFKRASKALAHLCIYALKTVPFRTSTHLINSRVAFIQLLNVQVFVKRRDAISVVFGVIGFTAEFQEIFLPELR